VLAPLTDEARFRRGRLIHRLLQELPDITPAARADAARRWLARPTHHLTAEAQAAIAAEVLAVIDDSRFAPLFGGGSRAEVPLSGEIDGQLITGQIDRLLILDNEVTVLDYKSDRPAPASAHRIAPVYLRQMAAYRALLRAIYPGRTVRCLLLWTEEPRPMPLDDTLLDRWAP
jgi:ATP-dependent helicase/nuclease subunit A